MTQSEIVLLGVGHTHAHVVRQWQKNPLPNTRLTCVTNHAVATYSGMLPGTLAGQYSATDMQIDLSQFCSDSNARLIQKDITGVDVQQRQLLFSDRSPLRFDALSIGVGSRPSPVPGDDSIVVRVKPMQTFVERLDAQCERLGSRRKNSVWKIAVVGGGAGGFEIACCFRRYLHRHHPDAQADLTIVDHHSQILKSMPDRTRDFANQTLDQHGIRQRLGEEISCVDSNGIEFKDGDRLPADLVLWATSATAPGVLDTISLPKDERGFLLTRNTLQSTAADFVYAVGDAGTLAQNRTAKAGVFAVRQGPILWTNLRRHVQGRQPISWRPQRTFLTLLNTGDDRAVLTYRGWNFHATWCWKLKDRIDRGFMSKFKGT